MSYCRFSSGDKTYFAGTEHEFTPEKSDVYLFEHYFGYLDCCGCKLNKSTNYEDIGKSSSTKSRSEMIEHLKEHIRVGHTVPAHVIPMLEKEIKEVGDIIE